MHEARHQRAALQSSIDVGSFQCHARVSPFACLDHHSNLRWACNLVQCRLYSEFQYKIAWKCHLFSPIHSLRTCCQYDIDSFLKKNGMQSDELCRTNTSEGSRSHRNLFLCSWLQREYMCLRRFLICCQVHFTLQELQLIKHRLEINQFVYRLFISRIYKSLEII